VNEDRHARGPCRAGRGARATHVALCAGLLSLAGALGAVSAHAQAPRPASRHLRAIPDPPCDVVVTPANAATTLTQLNDPALRVFCVAPGDYRSHGGRTLVASGTESAPRFLRFDGPGSVKAIQRSQRALFERLEIRGSWWVIQGLSIQPQSAATTVFVRLAGADHVVLDGNLVDGVDHPNGAQQVGVLVIARYGDPATHNVIQSNLVRDGDQSGLASDYTGIAIQAGTRAGEDNDWADVLDNEIVDWGDGVAVHGATSDCNDPGRPHGTRIDGNDIYVTSAKRVDCATGARDPAGGCACAENGIDVKAHPAGDAAAWTQITDNRLFGFRPTTEAAACGGSGALGQAITAGNDCPGNVFVARNAIADSTFGIVVAGSGWIVAGNLFHDIRAADGDVYRTFAILPSETASDVAIQWNTVVRADNAYDDRSADTDARCNAILDSPQPVGAALARGPGHVTEHNFLYQAAPWNFVEPSNAVFASVADARHAELCYWRRRWTTAQWTCVAAAAAGDASPHVAETETETCDAALGAPFGTPRLGYWRRPALHTQCGLGAELLLLAPLLRRARLRTRR
jgi:hypothetical protein